MDSEVMDLEAATTQMLALNPILVGRPDVARRMVEALASGSTPQDIGDMGKKLLTTEPVFEALQVLVDRHLSIDLLDGDAVTSSRQVEVLRIGEPGFFLIVDFASRDECSHLLRSALDGNSDVTPAKTGVINKLEFPDHVEGEISDVRRGLRATVDWTSTDDTLAARAASVAKRELQHIAESEIAVLATKGGHRFDAHVEGPWSTTALLFLDGSLDLEFSNLGCRLRPPVGTLVILENLSENGQPDARLLKVLRPSPGSDGGCYASMGDDDSKYEYYYGYEEDDEPLFTVKHSKGKKLVGAVKANPNNRRGKGKKSPRIKQESARSTRSGEVNGSDSDESSEPPPPTRVQRTEREEVIAAILSRWWYVLPAWPPIGFDVESVLERHKLRVVEYKDWDFALNTDEKGLRKCYAIQNNPGFYRLFNNDCLDVRPIDGKPCFEGLATLGMDDLYDMLRVALQNQLEDSEGSVYFETDAEAVEAMRQDLRTQIAGLQSRL